MTTHTRPKPNGTPTWMDISTPDLDAARHFYHAVFGWEYDIGGPEYGGYTTARLGQRAVAGLGGPPPGVELTKGEWAVYFASDRLDHDLEHALKIGATLAYPKMTMAPFGSMATCADPAGATFSFWQADQHIGSQINDEVGAVAWYELYTPDIQRAGDFYTALLGATAERMPGEMEYHILKHDDAAIAGMLPIDPAWGAMPAQWVGYFLVANVEQSVATVIANGGQIRGAIEPGAFGRFAALTDPQGAVFKIVENEAAA